MPAQAGPLRSKYRTLYTRVAHAHGKNAPGRNIVRYGVRTRRGVRLARHADLMASIGTLANMLAPAPVVKTPTSQVQSEPSSHSAATGGAGLPACASESGTNYSTGPDNTNASTATGRYQILQSTHDDLCSDLGWSPGDQDTCALRIYKAQGASAWVGCG